MWGLKQGSVKSRWSHDMSEGGWWAINGGGHTICKTVICPFCKQYRLCDELDKQCSDGPMIMILGMKVSLSGLLPHSDQPLHLIHTWSHWSSCCCEIFAWETLTCTWTPFKNPPKHISPPPLRATALPDDGGPQRDDAPFKNWHDVSSNQRAQRSTEGLHVPQLPTWSDMQEQSQYMEATSLRPSGLWC